jgi:hypothetical protein
MSSVFKGAPISTTVTAGAPSTAGPFYIDATNLLHWDAIASWTGTLTGAFKVESGADFDGPDRITSKPGTWIDVTARATPPISNPAGSAGNTEISAIFWTAAWARISLVGTGGSGVLTLALAGKS